MLSIRRSRCSTRSRMREAMVEKRVATWIRVVPGLSSTGHALAKGKSTPRNGFASSQVFHRRGTSDDVLRARADSGAPTHSRRWRAASRPQQRSSPLLGEPRRRCTALDGGGRTPSARRPRRWSREIPREAAHPPKGGRRGVSFRDQGGGCLPRSPPERDTRLRMRLTFRTVPLDMTASCWYVTAIACPIGRSAPPHVRERTGRAPGVETRPQRGSGQ